MRILHVNDHFNDRGGVEQYLLEVAGLLAEAGHENAIAYLQQDANTPAESRWPAQRVGGESGRVEADSLRAFIRAQRPDVAFIHHVANAALVEAVTAALPALAYVHGFAAVCPGLAKYYRRGDQVCARAFGMGCAAMHYLRRCSAARHPATVARLVRQTARLKAAYLRVGRYAAATPYMKGLLMQNGFESGRIAILPPYFARPEDMLPYCPPSRPNTLLYVGRLELEKGIPYLLNALALLPRGVDLMIAGDGTRRAQYERLAAQLGLAVRVEFLGWRAADEVTRCYREAAVTVMPSICPEAFGRAGVESFAQGRPVVAFRVGGIPDWLEDGKTGLLAEPADAAGLAARLNGLLAAPDRGHAMGLTARASVAKRYEAHEHLTGVERLLSAAHNG